MALHLVSRHPGALAWLRRRFGGQPAHIHQHLGSDGAFAPGDQVAGVLPLHWAARLCRQGVRVWSIDVECPAARRGTELEADELDAWGARLVEYRVEALPSPDQPHRGADPLSTGAAA